MRFATANESGRQVFCSVQSQAKIWKPEGGDCVAARSDGSAVAATAAPREWWRKERRVIMERG
jgi:hypothetical protein